MAVDSSIHQKSALEKDKRFKRHGASSRRQKEVAGGDGRLHLPAPHPRLGGCGRPGFESEVQRE